jgi:hypothetical protein
MNAAPVRRKYKFKESPQKLQVVHKSSDKYQELAAFPQPFDDAKMSNHEYTGY